MKGFGMRIENRQMEVSARVLPNPRLTYSSPANYDPKGAGGASLGSAGVGKGKRSS